MSDPHKKEGITDDSAPAPSEIQKRSGAAFDRIVGNIANGAVTAWIAASTGLPDAAATIGGVVGPLAEELSFAVRKIANVQQAQASYVITEAADRSNIPIDQLMAELTGDPARLQLLLRALEAAGRASSEAKLRLIGELLSTGALATDSTVVNEQMIAIETITDLDTVHFRLMSILTTRSPTWWNTNAERDAYRNGWPEARIVQRSPALKNAIRAIAARLEALGLVENLSSNPAQGPIWRLTTFGKVCIDALAEADPSNTDLR